AVSADGEKLLVAEDEYNSQPDRKMGLSRVLLCIDSDGDGKADKINTFCDKLNSPQGMCYVGGALYVTHAPFFTVFRDNTNDGIAWNSRLSQMQRDAIYGYPNLFKNYGEEIMPCIEDYGAGGATGSIYVHEPGFPTTYGDSLYTTDWAKGIIYRHELKPNGATFKVTSEEF